jgi:hypothetical protein
LVVVATPNVYEDARETPRGDPSSPRWAWLAVGLVLGAGATVLALGVDTASPESAETAAGPATAPAIGGISDVVDGFPDGLVAVTRSDGQSLALLIWPLLGEPYQRTIPVGASRPPDPVEFNATGRRIATLLPVPDQGLGVLYAGVPENAEIIANDVTGYAWHDSDPFRLAYTTSANGELVLWAQRPDLAEPEMVARAVGIEGRVAAWGEWGYAVQDEGRDSVVLFTENGEIKDTSPGRVIDSYRSGWMAIDDGGMALLSAGGGVKRLQLEEAGRAVLAGRFSPNGEKLGLLSRDGLQVIALDDDSGLLSSAGTPGVPQLTWSSDGRFALYPGGRGIWVVDTSSGSAEQVLTNRIFTGLGIAPLDGS